MFFLFFFSNSSISGMPGMPGYKMGSLLMVFSLVHAANICGSNHTLGVTVMDMVNLTYPGMDAVAQAFRMGTHNTPPSYVTLTRSKTLLGDLETACEALASYYLHSNTSSWLRIGPVTPGTGREGKGSLVDNVVDDDVFYLSGVTTTAKVPRNADGGLDWYVSVRIFYAICNTCILIYR